MKNSFRVLLDFQIESEQRIIGRMEKLFRRKKVDEEVTVIKSSVALQVKYGIPMLMYTYSHFESFEELLTKNQKFHAEVVRIFNENRTFFQ